MVTRHSVMQNKLTDGFNTRESRFTGFALPEDSKISSCTSIRGCYVHVCNIALANPDISILSLQQHVSCTDLEAA